MNRFTVFGVVSAILFGLLPFVSSRHLFFAQVNVKYFFIVGVVLVLSSVAAAWYFQGKQFFSFKHKPLLWAGAALLGVYWLSALLGVFPERSLFADIQRSSGVFFLTHIAVFAFLLGEFCTARDWSLVRRTIIFSAAFFSFFTILGSEGFGISGRILWMNLDISGFTFGNSTFAGTYLLLALVITLIELVRTQAWTKWWYALAGSALLIVLSPVLLSVESIGYLLSDPITLLGSARASSAAAILLLVFFGGYLLLQKYGAAYRNRALAAWGAVFVLAVAGGIILLFTPGSVVQEKYVEASSAARILVWQGGLEAFKERPVFGWGPENFERAFQGHFDNRLFQKEYIGEVWFDRAHNVIVDTLVTTGLAGTLAQVVLAAAFVWVVYRARRREIIGEAEAVILWALPAAHFLQLQTGFDTIGSFALLGVLGGYGLWLERSTITHESQDTQNQVPAMYYKVGAAVVILLVLVSAYLSLSEYSRQYSLYRLFVEPSKAKQLELAAAATSRLSSFESLRSASASLTKAIFEQIAEGEANAQTVETALEQMQVYEDRFRSYLEMEPDHYRARLHFAHLLAVETILGNENKLEEAKEVVAGAYQLSPTNLLTPALDALLYLYSADIVEAQKRVQIVLELNPSAPLSQRLQEHFKKQETRSTISVMRLEEI